MKHEIEKMLAGRKVLFTAFCTPKDVYIYLIVPNVNQYYFISGWCIKKFKILHIQVNSVHDKITELTYQHFLQYVDKFLEKITVLNAKRLASEETQVRDMYYYNNCNSLSQLLDDDTFEIIENNDIPDYLIYKILKFEIPKNIIKIPYCELGLDKYSYEKLKRKGYYFGR